jgi:hypothetical protein
VDASKFTPEMLQDLANQQLEYKLSTGLGKSNEDVFRKRFTPENAIAIANSNLRSGYDITGAPSPALMEERKNNTIWQMNKQNQPYLGTGTWTPEGIYKPSEQEEWMKIIQRDPAALIGTYDFNIPLSSVNLKDKIKTMAQKNLSLTPEQIKSMNNRPDLYNQYQAQVANFMPTMQQRYDEIAPKIKEAEDARSRAMRKAEWDARHPRPQPGGGFSIGGLINAFNPFKPVTNIASGKGGMQDYLSIAQMFL